MSLVSLYASVVLKIIVKVDVLRRDGGIYLLQTDTAGPETETEFICLGLSYLHVKSNINCL